VLGERGGYGSGLGDGFGRWRWRPGHPACQSFTHEADITRLVGDTEDRKTLRGNSGRNGSADLPVPWTAAKFQIHQ
jgi:hypothetical protein